MTTLDELLAKKKEIEQQIQALQKEERADALRNARAIIANFGFTEKDLFSVPREPKQVKVK